MTPRERFTRALTFQAPEGRLPIIEWAAWWGDTIKAWEQQGLPAGLEWEESLHYFGLDPLYNIAANTRGAGTPVPAHHGAAIVTDEASYDAVLPYLYPQKSIDELLDRARSLRQKHERGDIAIRVWLDGFFWFPRTLLGIEGHLYAFYDQPELMHRMNRDVAAFHKRTLEALFTVLVPDMVGIAEDMSYNNGPMLSRDAFNEFIRPYYNELIPLIKSSGVPVLVDSDGQIEDMIPWLQEAGIDGVYPLERQAGVDIPRIRAKYPRWAMMGGYDKMVMPRGEAAMRAEFERLLPVMRSGGFIVSVDHQTPPGVTLENYRVYVSLLCEYSHRAAAR
ncbi:MAG: uroporphyrinogen decarboxylase family protein [Capsulimonadaceae bacterium]|nr:uroporphyrinogen decarboxylase family protein [Capsulimonadaceae bacterium]